MDQWINSRRATRNTGSLVCYKFFVKADMWAVTQPGKLFYSPKSRVIVREEWASIRDLPPMHRSALALMCLLISVTHPDQQMLSPQLSWRPIYALETDSLAQISKRVLHNTSKRGQKSAGSLSWNPSSWIVRCYLLHPATGEHQDLL